MNKKYTADGTPIYCSFSELVKIDELMEHPQNPNQHPDCQLDLLVKIIFGKDGQGWRSPIVVSNRSGLIVKGHGRLRAARLAGATEVPVEYQDYETDEQELADLVADNRISELSYIDADVMAEIITDALARDFNTEVMGYDQNAIDDLMAAFDEDVGSITDAIEEQNHVSKTHICPECGHIF